MISKANIHQLLCLIKQSSATVTTSAKQYIFWQFSGVKPPINLKGYRAI